MSYKMTFFPYRAIFGTPQKLSPLIDFKGIFFKCVLNAYFVPKRAF
jgi:hypothetical protein